MHTSSTTVFNLPERLAPKADPALIAADESHLAAVRVSLDRQIAELSARLDTERKATAGAGQRALDRDLEVHRLTARLRMLRRFGLDLCLGRMVHADGRPPSYIGRLGLIDDTGRQLLIDWRAPAAEPFFAATQADPMGLVSRRRYRWTQGRITDYWDEIFSSEALDDPREYAALDDQSAFIASLGATRTEKMRDVLATIAADQDAIIRASSRGALVVDGGPGTGKTVVALHRAAYLIYTDPRLSDRRGGVLFVGPHRPYLAYIADVLPSLGEEGVQICTLRDLVAEGATATGEPDPEAARLKSSAAMVRAIEPAVALYEEPPTVRIEVESPWGEVSFSAADWAGAYAAVDPGTPHNEAHDQIWDALTPIALEQVDEEDLESGEVTPERMRRALRQDPELSTALRRSWTLIAAEDLVGDLWTVPAYLRRCAPWLSRDEVQTLQRTEPQAWTTADLPLLDAARHRLGDPETSRRRRRREAAATEQRAYMDQIVDDLLAADTDGLGLVQALRQQDLRDVLVDEEGLPGADPDRLAGPFAHVVVDEAQELTDAEWQMLLRRCPARSFTVVGDRAQARRGFSESWADRLQRVGFDSVRRAPLTVNYRTPAEIMAEAEPVIRAAVPDADVPESIRSTGVPVRYAAAPELDAILDEWLGAHPEGVGCVIGDPARPDVPRIRSLSPAESKGLEFDLVVLVDPQTWGAVDHYVAMTRATRQLVILDTGGEGPWPGATGQK